jgi:hypothetical protein
VNWFWFGSSYKPYCITFYHRLRSILPLVLRFTGRPTYDLEETIGMLKKTYQGPSKQYVEEERRYDGIVEGTASVRQ